MELTLDGVRFGLKEEHDFGWLRELGTVFCVFDRQDSGNIAFGVERDGVKKLVKFAGARTMRYSGKPEDAVARLKEAVPIYEGLHHPHLAMLTNHFEVGDGYALVFDWFPGECLHNPDAFPPPKKYTDSDSPFFKFRQLPVLMRLDVLKSIFEFHVHVEKKGYVAVDFYDGSILYDFKSHSSKICDIDFYQKKPYFNPIGRMWGSSRFMSPEEFELDAPIDERTNVFNMGAVAFGLVGGELDRSISKWEAGMGLYEVALKAVEKERNDRHSSVEQFFGAWKVALGQ
ncbi:serine/threonine protein kinase [Bacillus sp. FJAT-27445]|uniref:serine/threonine protein kinase n=1 Tax=Bacillus sp. FJAT-27445 TaxID=1679166 RepID=UPI000744339A|nr:serine/threonine protein kinase [Bacillus sp. FJAT-27445]